MGENQRKQAMLPEGATVFPNDIGTAPGCGVRTASGKVIVMLPGRLPSWSPCCSIMSSPS